MCCTNQWVPRTEARVVRGDVRHALGSPDNASQDAMRQVFEYGDGVWCRYSFFIEDMDLRKGEGGEDIEPAVDWYKGC